MTPAFQTTLELPSVPPGSLHAVVGRLALMEYADECNRTAGFAAMPESTRRGRMKFLRQYEKQKGLCAICREWFAPAAMTRDHITPRSKKGGTQWDNIQLSCAPCNHRKGDSVTAFAVVALRIIEDYSNPPNEKLCNVAAKPKETQ